MSQSTYDPYEVYSHCFLRNEKLSSESKGALGTILTYPSDFNWNVKIIEKITGLRTKKRQRVMSELKIEGYLKVFLKQNIDGKWVHVYSFTDKAFCFNHSTGKRTHGTASNKKPPKRPKPDAGNDENIPKRPKPDAGNDGNVPKSPQQAGLQEDDINSTNLEPISSPEEPPVENKSKWLDQAFRSEQFEKAFKGEYDGKH